MSSALRTYTKYDESTCKAAANLRQRGMSFSEVARALKTKPGSVFWLVKRGEQMVERVASPKVVTTISEQPREVAVANGFEIERGVPLPKGQGPNSGCKYPFAAMRVGDSFFVPVPDGERNKATRNRLTSSTHVFRRTHTKHKFTTRVVEGGIRVWRTA